MSDGVRVWGCAGTPTSPTHAISRGSDVPWGRMATVLEGPQNNACNGFALSWGTYLSVSTVRSTCLAQALHHHLLSKWFISQEPLLKSCHLSSEIYSSAFPAADPIGTHCGQTPRAQTTAQQIPLAVQHPSMVPPIQRFITFAWGLKRNPSVRLPQPCKAFCAGVVCNGHGFFSFLDRAKTQFYCSFPRRLEL